MDLKERKLFVALEDLGSVIVAYSGGRCKRIAQHPIHFEIDDMQIAADLQLIIGHMCMQWLCANPINGSAEISSDVSALGKVS